MRISDWSSDVCSSDLPAPATATGETAGLNAQDLNGLADRLQNPDERQKLVDTLRALAAARDSADGKPARSEERRVGKECVRTCRSRWSPYHSKKKKQQTHE